LVNQNYIHIKIQVLYLISGCARGSWLHPENIVKYRTIENKKIERAVITSNTLQLATRKHFIQMSSDVTTVVTVARPSESKSYAYKAVSIFDFSI
jgi:hypothetical protein